MKVRIRGRASARQLRARLGIKHDRDPLKERFCLMRPGACFAPIFIADSFSDFVGMASARWHKHIKAGKQ
jgi:hypothetical protein